MSVYWTDTAVDHVQAIHDYIATDSPQYAHHIAERIIARTEQLDQFPESGRIVPEYGRDHIRELIEGNYRIIYLILATRIDVIAIVHGTQQLKM